MHKIILIVGASGVGKDSLLEFAKNHLSDKFNFVKRHITRVADENEENFFLEDATFEKLVKEGFFIIHWRAHNNKYGIAKGLIKKGTNIISVSRKEISNFEKLYKNVYTINITLPRDILHKRLLKRGRETPEEIEKRLNRSYKNLCATNLINFCNDKDFKTSSENFIKLLNDI